MAVVSLAGCGSVVGAKQVDANTNDADLLDADATGTATVVTHAHYPGGPASGTVQGMVDLISLRPNGTMADQVKSDTTGNATIHVYPGGSVTAAYQHAMDMGYDFATFTGVKPGDTLDFGHEFGPSTSNNVGSFTATWPVRSGAYYYELFTSCGYRAGQYATNGTSVTFLEYDYCHQDPMFVLVVAFDTSFNSIAYSQTTVNFSNGGSANLNGWANAAAVTINVSGLPDDLTTLYGSWTSYSRGKQLYNSPQYSGQPTGGAYTGNISGWPLAGDRDTAFLNMCRPGNFSCITIEDGLQSNATSWTIAAPTLPPWDSGRISSGALKLISWFPVGQPTHDGNVVSINWGRSNMTTSWSYNWYFVTPPDQTTITLPELPAPFAAETPQLDDYISINQLDFVEIPSVTGYDQLRAMPESQLTCLDCAVRDGAIQRVIRSN